ncbi:hypothetical protein [Demequina sp.]|uniref:hypothetical protein n=1 Tax=Demequina sp. TaxID=2050685 RepID=UPI003A8B06F7
MQYQWSVWYDAGLTTSNICGEDWKIRWTPDGKSQTTRAYYTSNSSCRLPYYNKGYVWSFSGSDKNFKHNSTACSTTKWEDYNYWASYTCHTIKKVF